MRPPETTSDYRIALSPCKRFVVYRAMRTGTVSEDFARRRAAIAAFAAAHDMHRVMLDFRGLALPVEEGFVQAAVSAPGLRTGSRWRIAIVVALDDRPHSKEGASLLADLLTLMQQDARDFFDYDRAVDWLTGATS